MWYWYIINTLVAIIGLVLALVILSIIFALICSLFVKKNECSESGFYRFAFNYCLVFALILMNVHVHVVNKEKLPKGAFLYVSNHVSNFDPITAFRAFTDRKIGFLSKKSIFNIPIFGKIIRKCSCMEIDRENPKNAMKAILTASNNIKNGISMGVYPEGTRSKDGKLLPFHNGVFKIAQRAKAPVVIASVKGTQKVRSRSPFLPTHVYIEILDVIDAQKVQELTTLDIGNIAREKIYYSLFGTQEPEGVERFEEND